MYVVIIGGGRTGQTLAERLIKRGHDTAIVESDEERAQELAEKLDALVIHGNGADLDVLKDAGTEKADSVVAAAGVDEVNFMGCKLAKELGVSRVVTRINESKHSSMFEDLDVDAAISFHEAAAALYEKAATGPEMYGLLAFGGGEAEVVEVSVAEDSEIVGKAIKELDFPHLCTVAMITREGELIPPRGDTEFKGGDQVILAGKSEEVMDVAKQFRGK